MNGSADIPTPHVPAQNTSQFSAGLSVSRENIGYILAYSTLSVFAIGVILSLCVWGKRRQRFEIPELHLRTPQKFCRNSTTLAFVNPALVLFPSQLEPPKYLRQIERFRYMRCNCVKSSMKSACCDHASSKEVIAYFEFRKKKPNCWIDTCVDPTFLRASWSYLEVYWLSLMI